MIRIRNSDGTTQAVELGMFVEVVDDTTGKIGSVFFSPQRGSVMQISPATTDAQRYSKMFPGVQFADKLTSLES